MINTKTEQRGLKLVTLEYEENGVGIQMVWSNERLGLGDKNPNSEILNAAQKIGLLGKFLKHLNSALLCFDFGLEILIFKQVRVLVLLLLLLLFLIIFIKTCTSFSSFPLLLLLLPLLFDVVVASLLAVLPLLLIKTSLVSALFLALLQLRVFLSVIQTCTYSKQNRREQENHTKLTFPPHVFSVCSIS